jgi:hypothetical protein
VQGMSSCIENLLTHRELYCQDKFTLATRISNIAGLVYSIYEQTASRSELCGASLGRRVMINALGPLIQRTPTLHSGTTDSLLPYHNVANSIPGAAHVHSAIGAAVNIYELPHHR